MTEPLPLRGQSLPAPELVYLLTFGARVEVEGQDWDEVQRRCVVAEREIKNVLARVGLRPSALSSIHGPREKPATWGPGQ